MFKKWLNWIESMYMDNLISLIILQIEALLNILICLMQQPFVLDLS